MQAKTSNSLPSAIRVASGKQAATIKVKDEPGQFREVSKYNLHIDPMYQRVFSETRVMRMQREWSWVSCGVLVVSERRDGMIFVVDGQHRLQAAMRRSDIDMLPCIIFECDELSEEASSFIDCNTARKPMASGDKFRARVVTGDPLAVWIDAQFKIYGLSAAESAKTTDSIACLDSCWKMAASNKDVFVDVLRVAYNLARPTNELITSLLIGGLSYLRRNIKGAFSDERFIKRIQAIGCRALVEAARRSAAVNVRGSERVWGTGMLEELNRGLRVKFVFDGDALPEAEANVESL